MPTVYVVGMGPGKPEQLPSRNLECLLGRTPRGEAPVWLRTDRHPLAEWLRRQGGRWSSFDDLYERAGDFASLYQRIARELLAQARELVALVYGVPGHPLVGERAVRYLLELAPSQGVAVELLGAPSFLEAVFEALGSDPLAEGAELVDGDPPPGWLPRGDKPLLVAQVWHPFLLSQLKLRLLDVYPAQHRVAVVRAGSEGGDKVEWMPLAELDRGEHAGATTSLWVPSLPEPYLGRSLASKVVRVAEVVARLRGEGGCPWDREQTHLSLRPYVIEEAYEVAEAIRAYAGAAAGADTNEAEEAGPLRPQDKLAEELGDLLLQVALHAQIAREEGVFDLGTVCDILVAKLVRRHPHVFSGQELTSAQALRRWNEIKSRERGHRASVLDGIPAALPALQRAWRVQQRAHEVGFDWEPGDVAGVLGKVEEELEELRHAARGDVSPTTSARAQEEMGDLLFAAVNAARLLDIDPEAALAGAVDRFCRRFRVMERLARRAGKNVAQMALSELDSLWEAAKKKEKGDSCRMVAKEGEEKEGRSCD